MEESRLLSIRKHLMLKQGELAKKLKITQSYLSAIEKGRKKITVELLEILFMEIGVSPLWYYYSHGPIISTIHLPEQKENMPEVFVPHGSNDPIRDIIRRLEEVEFELKLRVQGDQRESLQFYTHEQRLSDEKKQPAKIKKERPA